MRSELGIRRFVAAFAVVLVAIAIAMITFGATMSAAATVYRADGPKFGEYGTGKGELGSQPQGAAVEEVNGDTLITSGMPRVDIFHTSGETTEYVGAFGEGEIAGAGAIAIDQAERVVYVVAGSEIFKYEISGLGTLTYTRDLAFPAIPANPGSTALAVDPTDGDLLVAEGSGPVSRYDSDGNLISSFDGAGSAGGTFTAITGLAVDATGRVYVVDMKSNLAFENPRSLLERFSPAGTPDPSFVPEVETPESVAVDRSSGNLIVVGRGDGAGAAHPTEPKFPLRLYTLHGDRVIDESDLPAETAGAVVAGLAAGGGGFGGHLYVPVKAGIFGGTPGGVYPFQSFKAPDLTLEPATGVTSFTADLSGSVNPLGEAGTYHFEYSREGGPAQSTPTLPYGEGNTPIPVSTELTDLIANSEYKIRLVATGSATGITVRSAPDRIITPAAPPLAATGVAYDLTMTSASIQGVVNPYGQQTTYRFEYGTTTAYGTQIGNGFAGHGREPLPEQGYLTGLQPGTEYHYRLVAVNGSGTSLGADHTFTTRSAPPPPRVYEQVSPVEKGGANVNGLRGMNVSPDGSHVMYEWKSAPAGAESAPVDVRTAAIRSPTDWSFQALDPPQLAGSTAESGSVRLIFTLGISEDGTKAVVTSLQALAPGAIEGGSNVYLRDTRTGEYTTLVATPGHSTYNYISNIGNRIVVDGTPDYSRVLLIGEGEGEPYLPGAPEHALYEWSGGQLNFASVAPDGTPLEVQSMGGSAENGYRDHNWISDDGSLVFFQPHQETFVRYGGQTTVEIGGRFCGATRDGHYGFVVGHDLTPDSEPGVPSLYRFDTETRETELLVSSVGEENCLQVSPDGQSVFFYSGAVLAPGAVPNGGNIYVWRNGHVQFIATTRIAEEFMASDNGRYFVFESYDSLTGYDNSSKTACVAFADGDPRGPNGEGVACKEVFRYDTETEELLCASCRPDGGPPVGSPRIGTDNVEGNFRFQRSVLDDGTVIFDTPDPLSARDSNSNRDVYTFDGREVTLISSGFQDSRAEFDGASADGRDIFFTTQDQLVGQDTDHLADIYDARIEGGIPGQNPPPPRAECIRDDCKSTPAGGPELPFGGSEGLNGPANVHAAKSCPKGRIARKVKGKRQCVKKAKGSRKKPAHKKAHKARTKTHAKSDRRQGR